MRDIIIAFILPESPVAACCGEADAYWADSSEVEEGRFAANITDKRADGPLGRSTNQPLIAIVDDDESVREATKDLMRSMGLAVEAFACGEDFLRSPHLSRTACLVADINMPGMSGLDLHRHLSVRNKSIPTILVTAYPNDSVRERALSAGVICYLEKPFSEDDLINGIRSAFAEAGDSGNGS
jgi:FixJ family two-component response regulator